MVKGWSGGLVTTSNQYYSLLDHSGGPNGQKLENLRFLKVFRGSQTREHMPKGRLKYDLGGLVTTSNQYCKPRRYTKSYNAT